MADPTKLAFASAFDSFKGNDYKTTSILLSGSIATGGVTKFSSTVTLLREESVTEIYFSTSANSLYHSTGRTYVLLPETSLYHTDGSAPPGFPAAEYNADFENSYDAGTLTLSLSISNLYPDPLTLATETISFEVYTFVGPFKTG